MGATAVDSRPTPVDAGVHTIEIDAPPAPKQTNSVTVRGAGDRVEWTVRASGPAPAASLLSTPSSSSSSSHSDDPTSSQRSSPLRTVGIITGAVGVGGILTGTVLGLMSFDAHSSVVARCPGYPTCPSSDRGAIDDLNDRAAVTGTISTIGFIAGAALLVGGAVLFLTSPPRHLTR